MPVSQTPVLCMYLLYKQSPGVTCDHVKINTVNVDNTCTSQAQRPDYCTQYLDLGMLLHWFVVVFGFVCKDVYYAAMVLVFCCVVFFEFVISELYICGAIQHVIFVSTTMLIMSIR